MKSQVKKLQEILTEGEKLPESIEQSGWNLRAVQSDECQSYVAWNEKSHEALLIDPKREDRDAYLALTKELSGYTWLAVIDTHTHADHVSIAAEFAEELRAPLVMHEDAPSRRVHLRVVAKTHLPSRGSPLELIPTPGHTPDSIVVLWGPYLFGGDTLLYGDTGRDDLPGGDAVAHFESLQTVKSAIGEKSPTEVILLPGHDNKGGRASSWETQLRLNSSLTQPREEFIREAGSFEAPPPKLLKESLRENFK